MNSKIICGMSSLLIASMSHAGVEEKKAARQADENITKQVIATQDACGNDELAVVVQWVEFDEMIASNSEALEADNYKKKWVIGHAGERTVNTLKALSEICSDEDYKEEIAKINKIEVSPKEDFKDAKSSFVLNDQTLTISSGHRLTRRPGDFIDRLKALF